MHAGGLCLTHRAVRRGFAWSGDRLLGGMAIGWGAFNLVEGIVAWDLGFLALGAVLVIAGVALTRRGRARAGRGRADVRRAA